MLICTNIFLYFNKKNPEFHANIFRSLVYRNVYIWKVNLEQKGARNTI